ncbi:MAG: right-handed parallel beta-helix repeat-containing protein [Candidatus Caenarcaniphilales bacterium]|jgi:parallel beta-helix repeat protein|nr:right-handed parallel beta-helix repeat-containing protein [Candidatus Caenarcaniphilales bacterium]
MYKKVFSLLTLLSLAIQANAAIINVAPGTGLQAAINNGTTGDILQLSDGLYTGNINFSGKAVTVKGTGKKSIIKGDGNQATVIFNSGEKSTTLLDQVTVTGGVRGGGILIENSSPRITRCWITSNKSIGAGSGVYVFGEDRNGNSASFFNNVIARNITRSVFSDNLANAVHIENSSPTFVNNTIVNNDRAGVYITGDSTPRLTNNIIAYNGFIKSELRNNKRGYGVQIEDRGSTEPMTLDYNLFFKNKLGDFNNEGAVSKLISAVNGAEFIAGTSFNANPKFKKIKLIADLSLGNGSAAINAGNPSAIYNDIDNSRNDIGATGGLFPNPDLQ